MENNIDLRRLHYFVVVAEELHFSRAAERLHMAQPPLSYQIQQLERELGVQLFERSRRNVQLTDAGSMLLDEAYRILGQIEQTVRTVQRVGQGEVGLLTIGFVPSASNSILPVILRTFHERFPEVRLFLKEQNPDQLIRGLEEKRLDVSFLYLPFEESMLEYYPAFQEPLVVALPCSHPFVSESSISLHRLANDFFILPPRYMAVPGLCSKIMDACRQAGFTPKVAQEAWLMQTIIGLVAANMGIALVPASVQNLHRTGIVYKPLTDTTIQVALGVLWRRGGTLPIVQRFLQLVDEIVKDKYEYQ